MENYEQKYKKALEIAKVVNPGTKDYNIVTTIFPELKKSEDELIREELIHFLETCQDTNLVGNRNRDKWIAWLKKQGKQEQLYIRFGEIPTNEKSKIYQGEMEVDTENGVSVYPAFKTNEGDIVLGLSLPITKTTLYTQQHLLEYDDRPCYLVKGTYVGKDTDGQLLINNISIIEKIDSYRVKEEKQGNPTEKVESKFKIDDFIVHNNSGDVCQITEIRDDKYCIWPLYAEIEGYLSFTDVDNDYHLWTIEDAKDGDILEFADHGRILIGIVSHVNKVTGKVDVNCLLEGNNFKLGNYYNLDTIKPHPATKEQHDLLFQKIEEEGYEWDAEKKELKVKSKSSWSEEDENTFASLCSKLPFMVEYCYLEDITKYMFWLGTLKQRLDGTK